MVHIPIPSPHLETEKLLHSHKQVFVSILNQVEDWEPFMDDWYTKGNPLLPLHLYKNPREEQDSKAICRMEKNEFHWVATNFIVYFPAQSSTSFGWLLFHMHRLILSNWKIGKQNDLAGILAYDYLAWQIKEYKKP